MVPRITRKSTSLLPIKQSSTVLILKAQYIPMPRINITYPQKYVTSIRTSVSFISDFNAEFDCLERFGIIVIYISPYITKQEAWVYLLVLD
jgi:hypothetical protein